MQYSIRNGLLPNKVWPGVAKTTPLIIISMVHSSYIPRSSNSFSGSRYYGSSVWDSIYQTNYLPFYSSLNRLAFYIGELYSDEPLVYGDLSDDRVKDIQKSVREGYYKLSPLNLSVFRKIEDIDKESGSRHAYKIIINDKKYFASLNPTLEDKIVLTSLARMLNSHFHYYNLIGNKALSMNHCNNLNVEYYNRICARGKVLQLYKFDLTESLSTINKELIMRFISNIVIDRSVQELIRDSMFMPIMDENGVDLTSRFIRGIPASGMLPMVLLNYVLTEFDKEFQDRFPGVDYCRYIHEVFISCPDTMDIKDIKLFNESLEDELNVFMDYLDLDGNLIIIKRGDDPVPCNGGLISVSLDGDITFRVNGEIYN